MSQVFSKTFARQAMSGLIAILLLALTATAHAQNAQIEALLDNPDPSLMDGFGVDVSIVGNIALVGTWLEDTDASGNNPRTDSGAAYVYERQPNGSWQLQQKLVAGDRWAGQRFGYFVDIVNDWTLAVSAPTSRVHPPAQNALAGAGAVYMFTKNSAGIWVQAQKIISPQPTTGGQFGWGLSLTSAGDRIAIGAPREAAPGNPARSGKAYVFKRGGPNPATHWVLEQTFVPTLPELNGEFGQRVLARSNELFISAPLMDVSSAGNVAVDAGLVFRYADPSYSGPYALTHIIEANDRSAGDQFGRRLAYNDTVLAVGSANNQRDASGGGTLMTNSGAVYLFDAGTSFAQTQKITLDLAPGHQRTALDAFGFGLAMDSGSPHILIGAPNERHDVTEGTGMIVNAGSIYHFELSGNTASFQQKLVATQPPPNSATTDRSYQAVFGYSLDLSVDPANAAGPSAITGSYKKILGGVSAVGRAYILNGF